MGLRIGTNVGALTALRTLHQGGAREASTLERMATGLRINRASDDPSGLLLLENLRADLSAIQQATENTQNAGNLVDTADAALQQIGDQIVNLRGNFVAALNTGVVGPEAQEALQFAADQGLAAIERIASTSRFGDRNLLNGDLAFHITGASASLSNIEVAGGNFSGGFPFAVGVNVISAATRAQASGTIAAVQPGASSIRITGPQGTQDVSIAAGSTQAQVVEVINGVSESTGVEATASGEIRTTEYGSQARLNLQELSGDLAGIAPGISTGSDIVAQVNGATGTGRANTVVHNGAFQAEITVQAGATGSFSFTIEGGGARFQLGAVSGGANDFAIGVGPVSLGTLGDSSGVGSLRDLVHGGAGSIAGDPGRGLRILDAAGLEVSALRSRLGSVSSQVFEPNQRALDVAFENLSASRSTLGDTDYAEEVSRAVRDRLVRDSAIQVLRSVNLNAGLALRLLA